MELLKFIQQLENQPNKRRKAIIVRAFQQLGLRPKIEPYIFEGFSGENIYVDLGSGPKTIIVDAHSDAYPGSPGANDDASGVAVCLDVARKLKSQRLSHKVRILITDQEEDVYAGGGIGVRAYVKRHGVADIVGVINLELVGAGDSVALWPVSSKNKNSLLLRLLRLSLFSLGLYHEEVGYFPDIESDYYTFLEMGVKNSFAMATFHRRDAKLLRKFVSNPLWSYAKYKMGLIPIPKLFTRYHNEEDKSIYLNEAILQKMSTLVYRVVTMLDKN